MKRIAILGSTGSIGQSALAVVDAHPRSAAGRRPRGRRERRALRRAGRALPAATIAMSTATRWPTLRAALQRSRRRAAAGAAGREGLVAVATHPDADIVLFASSGTAALDAVLAAIEAGKTIALANKEMLVMAGALVMEAARATRRRGAAGGQRAQRHPPVPARARAVGGAAADPDRLGRSVPRHARRASSTTCHAARRAAAPDVADGAEDHDRLGDADEQGARGDRGALAVRRPARSDRGRSCIRSRSCIRWSSSSTDR